MYVCMCFPVNNSCSLPSELGGGGGGEGGEVMFVVMILLPLLFIYLMTAALVQWQLLGLEMCT